MAELKFPSKFANGNLPVVRFTPHKFSFPTPSLMKITEPVKVPSSNDSVQLYLPGDFNENISSTWGLEDVYQGAANSITSAAISNLVKGASSVDGGKLVASASLVTGKVPFPTDVMIFKSVEPMSLQFAFNMIPYNQDEGNSIVKIIKNFKKAILPTSVMGTDAVLLNFPDIWDIMFVNINGMGLERDKIYENMCLTSCSVQYISGTENASVYHDNNPTQVRLNLTFQSLRKQFMAG